MLGRQRPRRSAGRARRLNLGIGETDAEDEYGRPGEDLRVPVRLDLGRHQPAGRPAAAEA